VFVRLKNYKEIDGSTIKLIFGPETTTSHVKNMMIRNFKSRWDIVLLAFQLSEIVKRQRDERKILKAMLQVTESYNSLKTAFFLHHDVFCTLNETETVNKVNFSYYLRVGLDGITFKKDPHNLTNFKLPKFFRRTFTFKQITFIKVDEAAEHKIQIGFKVLTNLFGHDEKEEKQIYIFPPGELDNDQLYLINFLRTLPKYHNVVYQFVPRADTDNPDVQIAQFAGVRVTPAEFVASKTNRINIINNN
jgi:hypothetical protein